MPLLAEVTGTTGQPSFLWHWLLHWGLCLGKNKGQGEVSRKGNCRQAPASITSQLLPGLTLGAADNILAKSGH